jgi:glycosyltransferase involved in cell wall biosynthesis
MIRVGFWFDYGLVYAGGLNYFRNLLHALHAARPDDIEPVLFMGQDVPPALEAELSGVARLVKLDLLTRGTAQWAVHRSLYRSVRCQLMVERILRRHRIDVVSHPSMVERLHGDFRLISWIPDFQYLHLPQLFPGLDAARRSEDIRRLHRGSDAVVLSSRDALRDFASIVGEPSPARTHVLPFVSQTKALGDQPADALLRKHGLGRRYFLLPNQFWEHKNHQVAFDAVARLKAQGLDVTLVCTGWMNDPRRTSRATQSLAFVKREGLENHIRLLGTIDYADVLGLMRSAVAIVNPSLFEGWSSSVEEAKSLGKPVLVSDIPVHREQAHPRAHYFDPTSADALAALMRTAWLDWPDGIDEAQESAARQSLRMRTVEFGRAYADVVRGVAGVRREAA